MPNDMNGVFAQSAEDGNIGKVKDHLARNSARPDIVGEINTTLFDAIFDPARFPKIDELVMELEKAGGDFEPVWRAIGDAGAVEKAILSMPEKSPGAETERAAATLWSVHLAGQISANPGYTSSFRALMADAGDAQRDAMGRVQHNLVDLCEEARKDAADFSAAGSVSSKSAAPLIAIDFGDEPLLPDDGDTLEAIGREMAAFEAAVGADIAEMGDLAAFEGGGSITALLPALADEASRDVRQLLLKKLTVEEALAPPSVTARGAKPPPGFIV